MKKIKSILAVLLAAILVCGLGAGVNLRQEGSFFGSVSKVYAEEGDEDYGDEESYDEESYGEEGNSEEEPSTTSGDMELQVIQVMAKGKNPLTGELYDMDKFVAGKSTIIRAQFSEERDIPTDGSLIVSISKDGTELMELLPISGETSNAAVFAPRSLGDVNNWEAGDYEFVLKENDEEILTRSATFKDAKKIKVLMVPVLGNFGGEVIGCEGEWKTGIQMTKDTYPLADDGVEVVLGEELDCSGTEFDVKTQEGRYAVWEALRNLQTPNNDYELVLGYLRNRQGEEGTTQGYTYGLPANIITESDGDMMPTVAHEIAHCYKIGDEYDGGSLNNAVNPAPGGMEGSDWNDGEQMTKSVMEKVVRTETHSGSLIDTDQVPFNTRTMEPLKPVGSWMGSGSPDPSDYWVTSDIWNHLYSAFVDNDPDVMPYADAIAGADTGGGESADEGADEGEEEAEE